MGDIISLADLYLSLRIIFIITFYKMSHCIDFEYPSNNAIIDNFDEISNESHYIKTQDLIDLSNFNILQNTPKNINNISLEKVVKEVDVVTEVKEVDKVKEVNKKQNCFKCFRKKNAPFHQGRIASRAGESQSPVKLRSVPEACHDGDESSVRPTSFPDRKLGSSGVARGRCAAQPPSHGRVGHSS